MYASTLVVFIVSKIYSLYFAENQRPLIGMLIVNMHINKDLRECRDCKATTGDYWCVPEVMRNHYNDLRDYMRDYWILFR